MNIIHLQFGVFRQVDVQKARADQGRGGRGGRGGYGGGSGRFGGGGRGRGKTDLVNVQWAMFELGYFTVYCVH